MKYALIYICVCVCVCLFEQHLFIEAYLVKYYRYPLCICFYFDPFKSPYGCYKIQLELGHKFSVIN